MAAIMTYEDGLSILKSALFKVRGNLNQPTLFLYIVHAYYEGWLEKGNKWPFIEETENYSPLEHLAEFINSEKSNDVSFLRPGFYSIYNAYKNTPDAFTDLYYYLRNIPVVWFEQPWPEEPKEQYWTIAFDELLSLIDQSSGKSSAEYSQPQELVSTIHLLMGYCNVQEKPVMEASKYDPFGGIGRFISPGEPSYYQDINQEVYALARLRSLAQTYQPAATRDYYCGDSTLDWAHNSEGVKTFDYIVSFPPMGLRVPVTPEMGIEWPAQKISIEDFLVCKGSNSLNEGGHLIGVFSNSILFAEGATGAQRAKLVKDKRIRVVIQLPSNILYGTGIPTCILVISDKSTRFDDILFIDASSFFKKEKRRNVLSTEKFSQILFGRFLETQSAEDLSDYVASIPVKDVIANDYLLLPSRYVAAGKDKAIDIPEGFESVPLGELVSVYRGIQTESTDAHLVRGRDLHAGGPIEFDSFENLPIEPIPSRSFAIKDEAILVLRVGNLKPTLFRPVEGSEVVLNPNVTALTPNPGIDPYYLISELVKPYVAEQVTQLSQGATIPHLKSKDLLTIRVIMPIERSLQHQAYLNALRISEEQRIKEFKLDGYIKRERNRLGEMMSIRRHRINPYISGLRSNVSMLLDELYASGRLEPSSELSSDYTVQDALENMEENLIQLKSLFDAFTVDSSIGAIENVDLIPFLERYSFTRTMPDRQFNLDKSLLKTTVKFPHIVFNRGNLTEIIDEIIHNAEKHFAPDTPGFSVMFVPRFDGKDVSLLICNNGEPVPYDFDEERSFVAGYHKDENGTGQGLFRVRQVCDEFGAKVVWENDPNNLMPTGLCITFKRSTD